VKKIFLILWFAAAAGSWSHAQTNTNTVLQMPREPTRIDSDRADFDIAGHKAIYRGNVRVNDPQMKLTCAQLVADLPQPGERMNHIVAETNVAIDFVQEKNQTNHATSDQAVYLYNVQKGVTNETVTFTGHAKIETAQGWLTGEPIIWNRVNNSLTARNQKMIYRQTTTNAAAVNTNRVSAPK
jgi:lipopolysaccharide transport protein LptA